MPFTVAVAVTRPKPGTFTKVAITDTPGCVGAAPFSNVGTLVLVVGKFTEKALLPNT